MVRVVQKYYSSSLEDTIEIGTEFVSLLNKNQVIAFKGDLGVGKTSLIKGLISAYCNIDKNEIISPTFIYLNIYNGKLPIYHFDLYRIKNENHFISMGFDEYLLNDNICLIEWSENIPTLLPKDTLYIQIEHSSENERSIKIY